jgi:hypothetical protein
MTAREIVIALGGRWCASYGVAKCPTHDDIQPSLSIRDADNNDIVLKCHAGCEWRDVKAALRDKGLLPEWTGEASHTPIDPTILAKKSEKQETEKKRRIEYAKQIWRTTKDPIGTQVETYLHSRAIIFEPIPPTIRFAYLKHALTDLAFPTMVAAVQSLEGEITGIHRTFLRADGQTKAPVSPAKMMLGECAGGAVRLGKAGERLGVGEGIETCLSVAQSCPDLPTWSALSTGGLRAVNLPDCVREVIILADGDNAGEEAARDAAMRLKREGRQVRIARPAWGLDFNKILMADALDTKEGAA